MIPKTNLFIIIMLICSWALYYLFKLGKALWYIASPRNLKPFYDWANKVNYIDKLIVKNHMHHEAQKIAMKFFFKKNYDYFIIGTDDIVGKPNYLRLLIEDVEKHGFPVISGWTISRKIKGRLMANLTLDPVKNIKPPEKVKLNSYNFVSVDNIIKRKYGDPFFKVWWVGLPLTLIRRDVLKKVPLRPFHFKRDRFCITPETKMKGRGKSFDLQFAIDCEANEIPIMVDARIETTNIGRASGAKQKLDVGKNPRVNFIKATAGI